MTGASLGNVPVPVSIALVFDDEDQVEARQNGRLQLDVLSCRLQVIIPACITPYRVHGNTSALPLVLLPNPESFFL